MSSPDVAIPPLRLRRASGRPGRFDPSEPFHMSTRRATTTSKNSNNSVNDGAASANGSFSEENENHQHQQQQQRGNNSLAAALAGEAEWEEELRQLQDEPIPMSLRYEAYSAYYPDDLDDDLAGVILPGAAGGVTLVDEPGPSPYHVQDVNSSFSGQHGEQVNDNNDNSESASASPSRKRKRTSSLDQGARLPGNAEGVDFGGEQQQQRRRLSYSGEANDEDANENEGDITEVIDPALLSDREREPEEEPSDSQNGDSQNGDYQNSSQSDEANPAADEVEVDALMDATPHLSGPESPATSNSVNDDDIDVDVDDEDVSAPLAKPLNEALQEVVRSTRLKNNDDDNDNDNEEADDAEGEEQEDAELAEEGDEGEEGQAQWGEDVRTRRKIGGRRRAAHPIPLVEAHMRRQAQLKSAYRAVARAQKAILAELAERTVDELEASEERHTQVAEYEHVMAGLDDLLKQRKSQLEAQRTLNKAQLFQRWKGEVEVARKKHVQRVEEARDRGLDELELEMLRELRIAQLDRDNSCYDTENENDIVPLLNRNKYRFKGREQLDGRYDSRSRRVLETRRLGDLWMRRLDLQDLIAEHVAGDADSLAPPPRTAGGDVAVMNSGPREYANARRLCVEDMNVLAAAAREVERLPGLAATSTAAAATTVVKNEDAVGLQLLGELASRSSVTGLRDPLAAGPKYTHDEPALPPPPTRTFPAPLPPPPHHHHLPPPPLASLEMPPVPPIQFAMSPRAANLLGDRLSAQMPPPSTPRQNTLSYLAPREQPARQQDPRHEPLPPSLSEQHRLNGVPGYSSADHHLHHLHHQHRQSFSDHHQRPSSRQAQHYEPFRPAEPQPFEPFRPGSFPPMRETPPETFPSPTRASFDGQGPQVPLWRGYSQPGLPQSAGTSSRPPSVGGPAPFPLSIIASAGDEREEKSGPKPKEEFPRAQQPPRESPRLEPAIRMSPYARQQPGFAHESRVEERLPPLREAPPHHPHHVHHHHHDHPHHYYEHEHRLDDRHHQRASSSQGLDPHWRDYRPPSMSEPPQRQQEQPFPRFPLDPQLSGGGHHRPPTFAESPREDKINLPSLDRDLLVERRSSIGPIRPSDFPPSQPPHPHHHHQHTHTHHPHFPPPPNTLMRPVGIDEQRMSESERPKSAVSRPSSSSASGNKEKKTRKRKSAGVEGGGGSAEKPTSNKRARKSTAKAAEREASARARKSWNLGGADAEAGAAASPPPQPPHPPPAGGAGLGGAPAFDGSPAAAARPLPQISAWPGPATAPPHHSPENRYAPAPPPHFHGAAGGGSPFGPPPPSLAHRYSPPLSHSHESERGEPYYRNASYPASASGSGASVPAPPPPPSWTGAPHPPPPQQQQQLEGSSSYPLPPPPGSERESAFNHYGPAAAERRGSFPLPPPPAGPGAAGPALPTLPQLFDLQPARPSPPAGQQAHHHQQQQQRDPHREHHQHQHSSFAGGPPLAPASAFNPSNPSSGGSSGGPLNILARPASSMGSGGGSGGGGGAGGNGTPGAAPATSLPAFAQIGQGPSSYRARNKSKGSNAAAGGGGAGAAGGAGGAGGFHVHKFHNYDHPPVSSAEKGEREREREREKDRRGSGGAGNAGEKEREKEKEKEKEKA